MADLSKTRNIYHEHNIAQQLKSDANLALCLTCGRTFTDQSVNLSML